MPDLSTVIGSAKLMGSIAPWLSSKIGSKTFAEKHDVDNYKAYLKDYGNDSTRDVRLARQKAVEYMNLIASGKKTPGKHSLLSGAPFDEHLGREDTKAALAGGGWLMEKFEGKYNSGPSSVITDRSPMIKSRNSLLAMGYTQDQIDNKLVAFIHKTNKLSKTPGGEYQSYTRYKYDAADFTLGKPKSTPEAGALLVAKLTADDEAWDIANSPVKTETVSTPAPGKITTETVSTPAPGKITTKIVSAPAPGKITTKTVSTPAPTGTKTKTKTKTVDAKSFLETWMPTNTSASKWTGKQWTGVGVAAAGVAGLGYGIYKLLSKDDEEDKKKKKKKRKKRK